MLKIITLFLVLSFTLFQNVYAEDPTETHKAPEPEILPVVIQTILDAAEANTSTETTNTSSTNSSTSSNETK